MGYFYENKSIKLEIDKYMLLKSGFVVWLVGEWLLLLFVRALVPAACYVTQDEEETRPILLGHLLHTERACRTAGPPVSAP